MPHTEPRPQGSATNPSRLLILQNSGSADAKSQALRRLGEAVIKSPDIALSIGPDGVSNHANDRGRPASRATKQTEPRPRGSATRLCGSRSRRVFSNLLRSKVELVRYGKSDVICNQGDIADSLYLV